jgi:hypothetical protein
MDFCDNPYGDTLGFAMLVVDSIDGSWDLFDSNSERSACFDYEPQSRIRFPGPLLRNQGILAGQSTLL